MWTTIVLVCALTGPCDLKHNLFAVTVPEGASSLAMCGLVGQAYIAQTALVGPGDRVKVLCRMSGGNGNPAA